MFQLELDEGERKLLAQVLERSLRNLREEIAGTEDYDYRQGLKKQEAQLKKLIAALQAPAPPPHG